MLFRLALRLGKTVQQLLQELSVEEFIEWQAFFSLEPWGFEIENWRAAMIGSTVANANRPPKQPAYKLAQFLPKREQPQTAHDMLATLKAAWGRGIADGIRTPGNSGQPVDQTQRRQRGAGSRSGKGQKIHP